MTAATDPAARLRAAAAEHIAQGRLSAPEYAEADVTAVLDELEQLREYVAALNEAQVGLQTSAFKAGWWSCRDAVTTNVTMPLAEVHALHYAKQVRLVTVATPQQPERDRSAS